jgi:hypothetical protein
MLMLWFALLIFVALAVIMQAHGRTLQHRRGPWILEVDRNSGIQVAGHPSSPRAGNQHNRFDATDCRIGRPDPSSRACKTD